MILTETYRDIKLPLTHHSALESASAHSSFWEFLNYVRLETMYGRIHVKTYTMMMMIIL